MKRFALLCVGLALVASAGRARGRDVAAEQPFLTSGPVLGGNRVFWAEATTREMTLLFRSPGAGPRVVYRKRSTPARQDVSAEEISASGSVLAFRLGWLDCSVPKKQLPKNRRHDRFTVRKESLGHELETTEIGVCGAGGSEVLAGRPRGPFRSLAKGPRCTDGGVISFDADRAAVALAETLCRRGAPRVHVVVRHFPRGPESELENMPVKADCCGPVAIAGRFVAWRAGHAIVVHDLAAGRTAYRAALPKGSHRGLEFDLGADGTLVVAIDNRRGIRNEDEVLLGKLFRFSPGEPAPHARPLGARALLDRYARRLRFAGGRLLYNHPLTAKTSELVLSDLGGRRRRLASFRPGERLYGDLDMTSQKVAWASRKDTEVRRICGLTACRTVADGVITIWTARIGRRVGQPRPIAKQPYSGLRPVN
jgi:hypothetical protein